MNIPSYGFKELPVQTMSHLTGFVSYTGDNFICMCSEVSSIMDNSYVGIPNLSMNIFYNGIGKPQPPGDGDHYADS